MSLIVLATFADGGGWSMFVPLLLLLVLDVALVRHLARGDREWRAEAFSLLLAQGIAGWLISAFFTSSHIGAGDSYHYGLQLADFLQQLRHGIFPVFVGQSEFGFNGNIHTLRTAPYYVHFGAVLHGLTGGRLTIFALQNLCVMVSALGGVTSAYAAIRLLAPAWRGAAPLLAALYVLCPMLMVSLVAMDMYATFLTLPWLPLFWLGVVGLLVETDDKAPLLLSTAALAITWYAHPAVGSWLTLCWFMALLARCSFMPRNRGWLLHPLMAIVGLGWVVCYLFVSVATLGLAYSNNRHGHAADSILSNLSAAWPAAWRPLTAPIGNLGNLQLGYALVAVWAACLVATRRTRLSGYVFATSTLAFLVLVVPVPGLTHLLWTLAPDALINASNVWPMQRFYPILAAAIPIWAALTLGTWTPKTWTRRATVAALVLGVAWSASQVDAARRHAVLVRESPAASATQLEPINVALTRSSYLMFDFYPAYYSHGVMEPTFETRLLDLKMQPLLDNASAIYAQKSSVSPAATLSPLLIPTRHADVRRREAVFHTDGKSQYLLAFSFGNAATGEIEIFGANLKRHYVLPEYGGARAFGAGPKSSPYLPICLPPGPPATITLRTEIPKMTARVFAFNPDDLPIKTTSLMPLRVTLDAPQPGFLETPRVFIRGYVAQVNGVPVPAIRSAEGLVAVRVPQGLSKITVSYDGPFILRAAFWFSAVGFAIFFGVISRTWLFPARAVARTSHL